MDRRSDELDNFKRTIKLTEYAASSGYSVDSKKSTSHSASMVNNVGDRIIVSIAESGHWQYFNVHDQSDRGTIIDFIQNRDANKSIGHVRQELRQWSGFTVSLDNVSGDLTPRSKDLAYVRRFLKARPACTESKYLASRGIDSAILQRDEFAGKILAGFDDAVIFPHVDDRGLCGYEVKKTGFTSFSEKGDKALWISNPPPAVRQIIICESPIECLSYCALFKPENTLYCTPCGHWSTDVSACIARLIDKYAKSRVIAGMNNDRDGRRHAESVKILVAEIGRAADFISQFPETEGADWNDILREKGS